MKQGLEFSLAHRAKEKIGFFVRNLIPTGTAAKPYEHMLSWSTYAPWRADLDFLDTYQYVVKHNATLVDIYRCYELWNLAKQASAHQSGVCNILEVGVYRGGTGTIIAQAVCKDYNTVVHLVDSFEGVVKSSNRDKSYKGGEHADTSMDSVQLLLKGIGLKNVRLYQGVFPDDVKAQFNNVELSLVHVDVDTYQSGKDIVEFVWPRLCSRGIVVFDDYGFNSTNGITDLCNELRRSLDATFIHNTNGHGIFIKA